MSWIGPRRAMLLIAIGCIGIGWVYRDTYTTIFGEPADSVGGLIIFVAVAFILLTIIYSVLNTC